MSKENEITSKLKDSIRSIWNKIKKIFEFRNFEAYDHVKNWNEETKVINREVKIIDVTNGECGGNEMNKKSNKRINEIREAGKKVINELGNELIKDESEIDELKNKINKEENEIIIEKETIKEQEKELINDKIEINELKEEIVDDNELINELGSEVVSDKVLIDQLKNKNIVDKKIIKEQGKDLIDDNTEINKLRNEIMDDKIEINELENTIVNNDEIGKIQRNELIDNKIEINELKNTIINNDEISKIQRDEIIDKNIKINELKDTIINNDEISKIQRNEIIDDKIEINELKDKVNEGETKMTEEIKTKEELLKKTEIENKLDRFVYIKVIKTIDPDISTLYLLKVVGIEIRFFIDPNEASKECRFMQKVIRQVIELGSDAKVEVKEIKTWKDSYYLMKIAGKNIKVYTHQDEAQRIAGYMQNVVDAVLKVTD